MGTLRGREIWELTRSEFIKLVLQTHVPKSRARVWVEATSTLERYKQQLKRELRRQIATTLEVPDDIFERLNPVNTATYTHYLIVKQALDRGTSVPWRSVQEYPDLQQLYRRHIIGSQPNPLAWLAEFVSPSY